MANYIRNRISFQGERERIDEVFGFMQGENGIMDFDKIIPMPQTYKDYDTTNYPDGVGIEDEAKKLEYKKATKEQKKSTDLLVGMTGDCIIGAQNGTLVTARG